MAKNYKIKITKAYYIAIEDKDGYEVASDWSFLDYTETKKQAEKMLAEVEKHQGVLDEVVVLRDGIIKVTATNGDVFYRKHEPNGDILFRYEGQEEWIHIGNLYD